MITDYTINQVLIPTAFLLLGLKALVISKNITKKIRNAPRSTSSFVVAVRGHWKFVGLLPCELPACSAACSLACHRAHAPLSPLLTWGRGKPDAIKSNIHAWALADISFTTNLHVESIWSLSKCPEARNVIYIHTRERERKLFQKNCSLLSMKECQAFSQNLPCFT